MSAPAFARAGLVLALVAASSAHATNGYFSHGYGVKSKGAAGVGAALSQDALVIATNPAGLVDAGSRLDLGLEFFRPERSAGISGNAFGADASYDGNGTDLFLIPEFGYNHVLADGKGALGIAVYGNGGMNTDYAQNPYARFGGSGKVYMNLEQLFVAPAIAWKLGERNTFGVAINLAWQRFEMQGVSLFAPFSMAPAALSDNGVGSATGVGVRVGWQGEIADGITLGASWQSKTDMGEFDKYAGLFADHGDFDIPENFVAGIAVKANDTTTIAIDWQTIKYGDVGAVGNGVGVLWGGTPLGADNGPGFGWRDMRVVKVAAIYAASETTTLRAGFSHGTQPIPQGETFFNIIAPGVVQDHLTLGGTWAVGEKSELSLEYAHAFGHTVHGSGSIPPGFPPVGLGGGEASGTLAEDSFGVAWSVKY